MKGYTKLCYGFFLSCAFCFPVLAQSYPTKPVRVIFPFPAGSLLDTFSRNLGQQITEATRQPVLVENRPGASSIIGMEACAKAAPDGYTLCLTVQDSITYNPLMFTRLPYDPENDFTPVTQFCSISGAIVASGDAPVSSIKQLITYAKANPGKINWGTWGSASLPEMYVNWIKLKTGVEITAIPYKGAGQAWPALLANEVQTSFIGLAFSMPQVKAGKVKLLAVAGARRSPAVPDLPSLAEEGADPGLNVWFGAFVPSRTPRPVVTQVNAELVKALRSPKMQEFMRAQLLEAVGSSPAEFAEFLKEDRANAVKVFKTLGIKPTDAPSS